MSASGLEDDLIRFGECKNIEELQKLINKTNINVLKKTLSEKLKRHDCTDFWNYLLQAFDLNNYEAREKRFACIKCFLDELLKIELSYKQTYDLITRLCQDLATLTNVQLIEILEHCVDSMRAGDPKCVSWKDLLPEILNVLAVQTQLNVNGVMMSGTEYRDSVMRNLCTMRWPSAVLTPMADMFKELHLTNAETNIVLNKFAGVLQQLTPMELPALAYQLFSMCNSPAHIIIPILALERYFHRYYYKKLFSNMCSNSTDFDSIDVYSDKELREAEETILHHLNYCTQYKMSETALLIVFRNFITMPDVILTPFVLSAIISMTAANRDPGIARLSTAILLPFLRTVIKNNEDERLLADYSVWCRDTLQRKQVDISQVFTVLIDQNKEGKDVITPGLVNLAFLLLKTKNSATLNSIGIRFLLKFIRKRFIFGQGIVKRIAEWMVVEQDHYQYSECLTLLSISDTLTVSECITTINYVMDFFLWLPGEQAMRMMSFIFPILKISNIVRDSFIDVLRKAMNSNESKTRLTAVYGFCMILKQLNKSNSIRSGQLNSSGLCTQQSISGFSLMTQSSFGNRSISQRNFDMLTLEIIGLLRNCFTQSVDIKRILYENLQRAIELNSKLVPHVLQFIDWHFRGFFDVPATNDDADDETVKFGIKYDQLVYATDLQHMEIIVKDNLGCLINFIAHCFLVFERIDPDYDVREMKRLLDTCAECIMSGNLKFENTNGPATHLKCATLQQQLNIIEGLISYALLSSTQTNQYITYILPLFKQHCKLNEGLRSLANNVKKNSKRAKNSNEPESTTTGNLTINGLAVKKINTQIHNIWDMFVVEKLLHLLLDDIVPFALPEKTSQLRANVVFVRYVFTEAAQKVETIRLEPEYKQLTHSKRMLKYLTDITKVVYERCIKCLPRFWRDFDLQAALLASQCFLQCLKTANETYKKLFKEIFVKGFDFHVISQSKESPYVIQDVIDEFMMEDAGAQTAADALCKDPVGRQIPYTLLQCLEILYDNIDYESRITIESYTWLLHFCQTYVVTYNEMGLVHKLLFTQRQKTHSGAFFDSIAKLLGNVLGNISDLDDSGDCERQIDFNLKSINLNTATSCLQYLYAALQKQIEDVDYFINKANNLNYKCRIIPDADREFQRANLDALERAICTQLIHISKSLLELSDVCIPLGTYMDSLMRLLMQHYACLKNLAKHYLNYGANITNVSIKSTKFDLLLRVVGKPLPTNIYALIKYIEENILEEKVKGKKLNPQAEKAKVLRETKLIPKIILAIETFNKHVILLSKKTNDRLANQLHFGTVRDFRIKTADLKAVIERTYSHSSQIEVVDSNLESTDATDDNELAADNAEKTDYDAQSAIAARIDGVSQAMPNAASEDINNDEEVAPIVDAQNTVPVKRVKRSRCLAKRENEIDDEIRSNSTTPLTPEHIAGNENNPKTATQLLRNLAKINKKSKKRALGESENKDADVPITSVPEPIVKRRRRHTTKNK